MGIQIKTSGATRPKVVGSHDLSSECSYSPGPKTPNLVARLMGLDLLPDHHNCDSPSSLSSSFNHGPSNPLIKSHSHNFPSKQHCPIRSKSSPDGTRSLPETPRISSARRSDVDYYHHRLSLQINKENISSGSSEDLECLSRYSSTKYRKEVHKRCNDENRSPSHYAKQIVKQVKESVSRKAGLDITNTVKNREYRRDQHVMSIKLKKSSGEAPKSILSSSNNQQYSQSLKVSSKSKSTQPQQENQHQKSIQKSKNVVPGEGFGSRLKKQQQSSETAIRKKQEEPFVRPNSEKKSKKNSLLNIPTVPTLLPVKKDPSPPATKLPQKQSQALHAHQACNSSSQLFTCPSQKYKQKATHMLTTRDNDDNNNKSKSAITTFSGSGAEFQYVTRILKRTGIEKDTPVSFSRWFSPSHPLDPSIFHYLEHFFSPITPTIDGGLGQLCRRCNRKLIFHLTDEILVEILKPFINMKPWVSSPSIYIDHHMKGSELIENLCTKIRSFPLANCQDLQDIHGLIDKDLQQQKQKSCIEFEEEGEDIVLDIERDIMDSLVQETVELLWNVFVACTYRNGVANVTLCVSSI